MPGHMDSVKSSGISKIPVSLPVINGDGPNLRSDTSQCIFYNVITDYFPLDDSAYEPTEVLGPLNLHKGEIVQFVRVHENNTVVVKTINKLGQGIVPLRCLSMNMELTTISSPSSLKSSQGLQCFGPQAKNRSLSDGLCQEPPSKTNSYTATRYSSVSPTPDMSESSNPESKSSLLKSCRVVGIAKLNNRIWYRVDVTTLSDHKRYLCRYYQNFYQLHCLLIAEFRKRSLDPKLLPILPKPMANANSYEPVEDRVNTFTAYLQSLILSEDIPADFKQTVFYDQWLNPKPGDVVQTPRGSLYNSAVTTGRKPRWTKLSDRVTTDSEELVAELLQPEAAPDHPSSTVASSQTLNSSTSISQSSSPLSSPQFANPLASFSQPTSPVFNKTLPFGSDAITMMLKINLGNDCYVIKCLLSDIDTWDKFQHAIHTRLIKDLPDGACPLNVKVKSYSLGDSSVALDSTNYDIDTVLCLSQNRSNSELNSRGQFNKTSTYANNDLRKQRLKLNLEVSI